MIAAVANDGPATMPHFITTRLLPLVLGGISVFGFAPYYLFPLPVLALAGLFLLLREAPPREAFRHAWLFGLGWFGAGVSWVYVSMHDVGGLALPVAGALTLLFAACLAVFPAAAAWLAARHHAPAATHLLLLLPALWALAEWLRGWLLTGFPWQALGYSQAPGGPLAAWAPLLGVYGVSWLAALSAGALALRRPWPLVLAAALWVAGLGLTRVDWSRPDGAPVTVSLLQGNVAQEMKFRPEKLADTLALYRDMVLASRARLIVLPETAWPVFLDEIPAAYLDPLRAHARALGGHLLAGVPEREPDGRYYNSVAVLDGGPVQTYRKAHLVPFGEFVPWGFRWFVDAMAIPLSDFSRGAAGQPPLAAASQRIAANVCYEDAFGEELIHALPAASLMVNVSNDAWFGDSFAPWQHLQIAQMRALETGRWWLRANNTGITAVLDAKGRVVASLEPFTVGRLDSAAQGMAGATPYSRWGNAAFLLLAALSIALAAWRLRRAG